MAESDYWSCRACTFAENPMSSSECTLCESKRQESWLQPPVPPPSKDLQRDNSETLMNQQARISALESEVQDLNDRLETERQMRMIMENEHRETVANFQRIISQLWKNLDVAAGSVIGGNVYPSYKIKQLVTLGDTYNGYPPAHLLQYYESPAHVAFAKQAAQHAHAPVNVEQVEERKSQTAFVEPGRPLVPQTVTGETDGSPLYGDFLPAGGGGGGGGGAGGQWGGGEAGGLYGQHNSNSPDSGVWNRHSASPPPPEETKLAEDQDWLEFLASNTGLLPAAFQEPPSPPSLQRLASQTSQGEPRELKAALDQLVCKKVVATWTKEVAKRRGEINDYIVAHTWKWRAVAKDRARKRREQREGREATKAYLLNMKKEGFFLTLEQENFLRVEDHEEGKLYDCDACLDEFPIGEVVFLKCKHMLCAQCMENHVVSQLDQGNAVEVECIEPGCLHRIDGEDIAMILRKNKPQYNRYLSFMLDNHLDSDKSVVRCPKPACQTPMIRAPGTEMCRCPKCSFTFCAKCKIEWHADATCEQYQQWKKDNARCDDLYEEWKKANTKACPKCSAPIQKNGGCNHMTCRKRGCGHQFCWLCMKEYSGGHFNSGSCKGKQFT